MLLHSGSSISELISFDVSFPNFGSKSVSLSPKSATFSYPCSNLHNCTPYTINISEGTYKLECWGSKGSIWVHAPDPSYKSKPGLGGYSSGIIRINSPTTFYVYVGATGRFNSVNTPVDGGFPGGGATDVRTHLSDNWFDFESLKSRIMVSGGGGGSEWSDSIGGNGGGLTGGISYSAYSHINSVVYSETCSGGNQTNGGICPNYSSSLVGYSGYFGSAGSPQASSDLGGFGGGGYYGGGSIDVAGAGSGGSSYISGYPGCNSITNHSYISHINSPFHFSGYHFQDGQMITGNTSMPLPSGSFGIWSESHGKFRITFIGTDHCITSKNAHLLLDTLFHIILVFTKS